MTEEAVIAHQKERFGTKYLGNFFFVEENRGGKLWHVCKSSKTGAGRGLLIYNGTRYCMGCGESLEETKYSEFIRLAFRLGVEVPGSRIRQ